MKRLIAPRLSTGNWPASLTGNGLALLPGLIAWWLWAYQPDLYYTAVQEDELLEWSSFWAFIIAGIIYIYIAAKRPRLLTALWFPFGLMAFCLFVAFEEISWGQRIFGYRPPEYFLEFNYQQELNLHNIIDNDWRKIATALVIFGYGVVVPLAGLFNPVRKLYFRFGILAPQVELAPAFLLCGIAQQTYPINFTGEWVELTLGMCFMFAALTTAMQQEKKISTLSPRLLGITVLMVLAGILSTQAVGYQRSQDPALVDAAKAELDALKSDFRHYQEKKIRCGFHKRIYTYSQMTNRKNLTEGSFASLTQQGLPDDRAEFFLDPWNYAYWLRHNCAADGHAKAMYLYSFGPNRRRESTRWEIRGDDIAIPIFGNIDDFRNDPTGSDITSATD